MLYLAERLYCSTLSNTDETGRGSGVRTAGYRRGAGALHQKKRREHRNRTLMPRSSTIP